LLASRAALAAEPPTAPPRGDRPTVAIEIGDEEVRYGISMPIGLFDALVKVARKEPGVIDRAERERASAEVEKLFKDRNPVRIDGILVGPVLKELEFIPAEEPDTPSGGPAVEEATPSWLPKEVAEAEAAAGRVGNGKSPDARPANALPTGDRDRINIAGGSVSIVLSYGTKGKPRRVSVVWRLFPDPGDSALAEVRAGLVAYGDFREIRFTPDEPEYIWHALEAPTRKGLLRVRKEKPAGTVSVPVVSLGILAALVVALAVLTRLKVTARVGLGVSAIAIAAAVATVGVGRAEVRLSRAPRLTRPAEAEAKEMFRTLHRNIYRAFDYKKEEDIYDALAQSVEGELLDEIYNEVYQSLVMRDMGGAVCRVQSVKVVDMRVEPVDDAKRRSEAGFDMRTHWLVNGAVSHWGHTHFRTNEYRAVYTVEPREGAWKITAARVLEYKRIMDDNPAAGVQPNAAKPGETRARNP
jgi:hypothetical protein